MNRSTALDDAMTRLPPHLCNRGGFDQRRRRSLTMALLCVAGSVLGGLAGQAGAQESFPSKPIRLVVPYPAGGPLDLAARALAERVRETLGVVVVENRAGAGGNIGADYVSKQAPDGHTLVVGAVATHAINPSLFAKLPYDAQKDFTPITLIAHVPNVLVMTPETASRLGIDGLPRLLAYLRSNPGKLTYASGGIGSGGHMAGELLKSSARVSMVHLPYAGAGPAQLGLLAGQTELMFDNLASASAQIQAGKLIALAVTTPQRAPSLPEVPTVAEVGGAALAGFDISTWFGVFGPAGLPAPIVARLNSTLVAALKSPDMAQRLGKMAAVPSPGSPEALAQLVESERVKYRAIVKFSGAKPE